MSVLLIIDGFLNQYLEFFLKSGYTITDHYI